MKFTVHRTSDWGRPNPCNPPLPNCVFEERTDKRLVKGGYWPDSKEEVEQAVNLFRMKEN